MSGHRGAKAVFSLDETPEKDRVKKWREYIAEVYCRQDVRILSPDRLLGVISRRSIGDFVVSNFRSGGAQRVVRTEELAKLDDVEHFHFVFPIAGQFSYQQRNNEGCATAGKNFILNASRGFRIDFSDSAESLVIAVPGASMRKRIVGIDDFATHCTLSDPLLVRVITDVASDILNIESNTNPWKIQELLMDLLDVAVTEARVSTAVQPMTSGVAALFVERIRGIISEKCATPAFRVADLAVSCGFSRRQVQKLLRECETTFCTELLNARLARAAYLLQRRSKSNLSIGLIAQQCGFASNSYFSSSYKKRFGSSPKDHHDDQCRTK